MEGLDHGETLTLTFLQTIILLAVVKNDKVDFKGASSLNKFSFASPSFSARCVLLNTVATAESDLATLSVSRVKLSQKRNTFI